jgi:hypothetical protein
MDSSSVQPVSLRTGAPAAADSELADLTNQVQQGKLDGLREYLARTRKERDWQDRIYVLELVPPRATQATLDEACEAEPQAADLFLIRCAYLSQLASTMRGTNTSDQVGKERYQNSAECVKAALKDLERAAQLDPEDPTPHTKILKCLTIFGQTVQIQQAAFQKAIAIAPDLVPAYFAIVNAASQRWYGSHEQSLKIARAGIANAGPGSDMATCLFWAHMLIGTHYKDFDENPRAAMLYWQNLDVRRELDLAFDEWTKPPYVPRRSSIPFLRHAAEWYRGVGNQARLARVRELTGDPDPKPAPAATAQKAAAPSPQQNGKNVGLFGGIGRIFSKK